MVSYKINIWAIVFLELRRALSTLVEGVFYLEGAFLILSV